MSTKQNIIDETLNMFIQYGVKSVRMDDIASSLGISKRTIYEIFGDKETLITECVISYHDRMDEEKRCITHKADNVIEEFMLLMKEWDNDMDAKHKLMAGVKKFYPKIYERVAAKFAEEGYNKLRIKLKEGVEQGLLVDHINLDLAISVLSHSIFGVISNRNMHLPNNVSETDAFRYIITYFLRGIATDKGIKMIDDFIEAINKSKQNK